MVQTQNPNGRNNDRLVPSNSQVTQSHLQNLLSVIQVLNPFLFDADAIALRNGDTPKGSDMDKEVLDSAITTFIKTTAVIDDILADKKRWSCEGTDKIEATLAMLYEKQTALAQDQKETGMILRRPSTVMKPAIFQLDNGIWIASAGPEPSALRGIGASPDEAMISFDRNYFMKATPPQAVEASAEKAAPVASRKKRKRKSKK